VLNLGSHPGIGYGWYSTNKSSAYPTTASTSHFSLTGNSYLFIVFFSLN
jgi:hypothetical protein